METLEREGNVRLQWRRSDPRFSQVVTTSLVVLTIFLACVPPKLYHFDVYPFNPALPIIRIQDGWLAVDSCEHGIHVLVEMDVKSRQWRVFPTRIENLGLIFGSSGIQRVRHVRVDGPLHGPNPDNIIREGSQYPYDIGSQGMILNLEESVEPFYVVVGEFVLDRLPQAGDSMTVVHGLRMIPVHWDENLTE